MSSGQASGRDMNNIKVDERYSKEYNGKWSSTGAHEIGYSFGLSHKEGTLYVGISIWEIVLDAVLYRWECM